MENMRSIYYSFGILLFVTGCAHAPRRESGNCASFCHEIQACAKRAHHASLGRRLCAVARCETGDKCRAELDSPRARYQGAFQFSPATWNASCEPYFERLRLEECRSGDAIHDLCCATMCAAEMVAAGGIGNWPVCGR
jgi:hypothetical protein